MMESFALFEDGHVEKIDTYKKLQNGDIRFRINGVEYWYTDYIFKIVDGVRHVAHTFYEIACDDTQMILAPITEITIDKTYKRE